MLSYEIICLHPFFKMSFKDLRGGSVMLTGLAEDWLYLFSAPTPVVSQLPIDPTLRETPDTSGFCICGYLHSCSLNHARHIHVYK